MRIVHVLGENMDDNDRDDSKRSDQISRKDVFLVLHEIYYTNALGRKK